MLPSLGAERFEGQGRRRIEKSRKFHVTPPHSLARSSSPLNRSRRRDGQGRRLREAAPNNFPTRRRSDPTRVFWGHLLNQAGGAGGEH